MRIVAAGAVVIAALAAAGCGSAATGNTAPPASAPATHSAVTATPNSGTVVTCASLSPIIRVLVADQRNQDRTYQEKWVMGNQGGDLNDALDATDAATTRPHAGGQRRGTVQLRREQLPVRQQPVPGTGLAERIQGGQDGYPHAGR